MLSKKKESLVEAIIQLEREGKEPFAFRIYKVAGMSRMEMQQYLPILEEKGIIYRKKDKYSRFIIYGVDHIKYAKEELILNVTKRGIPLKKGQSVDDFAKELGISRAGLYHRLKKGWKFVDGGMKK